MAVRTPWKVAQRRAPSDLEREEDRSLATLASGGDEEAFAAIFERHHRGLLTLCRHMLGSREEAEDALQHTFAAAYRQLTRIGPPQHLRAWLYATARNRCSSVLRARRELPHGDLPAGTAWLPDEVERRSDLRELLDDIVRLPDEQRMALVLAEIEELDHAEIAEILACRPGKVRALVFQARSTLGGWREARATPCREVREELAVARGPELRRAYLSRHLAVCPDCTAFREDVDEQRRRVALLLPPIPIALALKEGVIEAAIAGAAGGGAAAGGAAAGGAAAGGAGAAAGGAGGGAAAGGAGGAAAASGAGGGGAAVAGGAAAGGGVATAVKVGAAALVIGGAGVAGFGGFGGGDDSSDRPPEQSSPPTSGQTEPSATATQRSGGSAAAKKKKSSQRQRKSEKRLRANESTPQGGASESVEESTAPAVVNPAGSTSQAPAEPAPAPAPPPAPEPAPAPAPPPDSEAGIEAEVPANPVVPEDEIQVAPPVDPQEALPP